jgi:hypothetical protein
MILPHYSYLIAGLIPQATVKIYPDSAHGFLFQHHAEFAADVEAFLSDPHYCKRSGARLIRWHTRDGMDGSALRGHAHGGGADLD